jgi:hypothetical protein
MSPVVQMWEHVENWLLHEPTYEKASQALPSFMDLAVQVGLLCHPTKTLPPCQSVKYCGYIYDTRGIPTLQIPSDRRDKALAMVQWVSGCYNPWCQQPPSM